MLWLEADYLPIQKQLSSKQSPRCQESTEAIGHVKLEGSNSKEAIIQSCSIEEGAKRATTRYWRCLCAEKDLR